MGPRRAAAAPADILRRMWSYYAILLRRMWSYYAILHAHAHAHAVCVSRAPNDPGEDDGPSAVLLTWRLCPGAATDLRRQLAGPVVDPVVGSTTCPFLV